MMSINNTIIVYTTNTNLVTFIVLLVAGLSAKAGQSPSSDRLLCCVVVIVEQIVD